MNKDEQLAQIKLLLANVPYYLESRIGKDENDILTIRRMIEGGLLAIGLPPTQFTINRAESYLHLSVTLLDKKDRPEHHYWTLRRHYSLSKIESH
jgi:hypothetical protein